MTLKGNKETTNPDCHTFYILVENKSNIIKLYTHVYFTYVVAHVNVLDRDSSRFPKAHTQR